MTETMLEHFLPWHIPKCFLKLRFPQQQQLGFISSARSSDPPIAQPPRLIARSQLSSTLA